ncbi:MAG TPA: hypothetical protein VIH86_15060, partial [Puia sp.]
MITITQQPNGFTGVNLVSAGNDSIYTVSSTTFLSPNTTDYKFIADVYVNGELKTTLKSFPDPVYSYGVFNLKNIASNFVSFDFLFVEDDTIFHNCPNSSAEIYLEFGEEYSVGTSTGSTFVQNKNIVQSETALYINSSLSFSDYIKWNSGENLFQEFILGVGEGFFLQNGKFESLEGQSSERFKAFTNQRKFLYYVNGIGEDKANQLIITTADANFDVVGQYHVNIPDGVTSRVQSIEVGYPQLAESSDVVVDSGANPIFSDGSEAFYFLNI